MAAQLDDQALDALLERVGSAAKLEPGELVELVGELRRQHAFEARVRASQDALIQLARSEAIGAGDLDAALREINETAAKVLDVQRSSVWRYSEDESRLECLALYEVDAGRHSTGVALGQTDFPIYFESLRADRVIVVDDALGDPRLSEFAEIYVKPLGIHSLLDAPIRVGGRMIGVTCNEQTSGARVWTPADQGFAANLADFVALAFESHERQRTEAELRAAIELAEQRLETIERQRAAIADLSAPIIDIWEGVVAVPIVGLVDSQRSIALTERLLERIAGSGARSVIIDLTGVDVVDTMTADHLLRMTRSASLLGTVCVLSGIRPAMAQTFVRLQVDLSTVTTVRSLKEALEICIGWQGS